MNAEQKVTQTCRHCDKSIVYDREKKMWFAVAPRPGYYCPADPNTERCQHLPK